MTTTQAESATQAPRLISGRARRRAWAEAHVRLWWMSAALITFVAVWLMAAELVDGMNRRARLKSGIPVVATVESMNGAFTQTRGAPVKLHLRYTVNGAEIVDVREHVLDITSGEEVIRKNDKLSIRVDPNDPTQWIEDRPPQPIFKSLGMGLAILPIGLILMLVAFVRRNSVLKLWREGREDLATVIAQRSSSLAPGSQLLSVTLEGDAMQRIVPLLHPRAAGLREVGDRFAVIAPSGKPHRAIESQLYQ